MSRIPKIVDVPTFVYMGAYWTGVIIFVFVIMIYHSISFLSPSSCYVIIVGIFIYVMSYTFVLCFKLN